MSPFGAPASSGFGETETYYDILEISPDASPAEIRASYLRLKAAYSRDSVALYSLISAEETDITLKKIEDAYQVLSNDDRRREYDRNHGITLAPLAQVISIDRIPPMDSTSRNDDLLIAPKTDFGVSGIEVLPEPHVFHTAAPPPEDDDYLRRLIAEEIEWRGAFLRKIREARRMTIEELSDFTKVSKSYLNAMEDEDYNRLPAAVYVRGFLLQVCKRLRLPGDKVSGTYVARYRRERPDKA